MAKLSFIVPPEYDGFRVDSFLRAYGSITGSALKRAKRVPLGITQNGEHIRTIDNVTAGSKVEIDTAEVMPDYYKSEDVVDILFENEDIIVFNKPHSMPIHPSVGNLKNTLLNVFAGVESVNGLKFRSLNRLDKDTSGIAFVAKNAHIASYYPKRIEKQYLAIVKGKLPSKSGVINSPIDRIEPGAMRRAAGKGGKNAVTHFKVVHEGEDFSAVLLKLQTGRTHQIRVHLSHIGFPLLGDTLYDGDTEKLKRQALHCMFGKIEDINITAPIPQDFKAVIGEDFAVSPMSEGEIDESIVYR